ncbi:hypothetical protein KC19_12G009100 [Ceratodon purpureus]|uniref:Uncharacterized protein n=1 Tax=Ceratodon purpureus TaxID=3225 RepID=A0A8T0G257_CERPU|nr:hypothetical protein KC19_12G009100 [Ceratodon purpureus]
MSVNDLVYLSNEGFHENYLAVAKCTDHDLGVCTVRRRESLSSQFSHREIGMELL